MKPTDLFAAEKEVIQKWRASLYDFDAASAKNEITKIAANAHFRMCFPFGDIDGSEEFFNKLYIPLAKAWKDLERRDTIIAAGKDEFGGSWVGCCGFYCGTFLEQWLDIPPTGHLCHMRFHEFYRIEDNQVVEVQAIWDIPEVMMQAGAWPLAPSLGKEWCVPAPATQDGLAINGSAEQAENIRKLVIEMLTSMKRHPSSGPEFMEMEKYWHENFNWYGPAGIGTSRGIAGFRHWHQIPFLRAMPDRGKYVDKVKYHFFAEGNYAAVTGWPNMIQTITNDGWLGIAPSDKRITMRSLDFWRFEKNKIRENWVMVDLLDMYNQIGVDVFARLREFNKARNLGAINFTKDY